MTTENNITLARREVEIHNSLNHKHIVKLVDVFEQQQKLYLVMEYAEMGTLFDLKKKQNLPLKTKQKIFYQVLLAVKYLHENDIIHRDIKPENIFLDKKKNVKLGDFGWSRKLVKGEVRKTFCGTYEYMAPEILENKQQSKAVDVWSVGVLLYELMEGKSPFAGKNMIKIYQKIMQQKITFSIDVDPDLINLLMRILTLKVNKRPTIEEILQSSYVKKIRKKFYKKERTDPLVRIKRVQTEEIPPQLLSNTKIKDYSEILNTTQKSYHKKLTETSKKKDLKERIMNSLKPKPELRKIFQKKRKTDMEYKEISREKESPKKIKKELSFFK